MTFLDDYHQSTNNMIVAWITGHPITVGWFIAIGLTALGVCFIVGAVKDWDWLYEPDDHYQNNSCMGQITRYLGRGTA